MREELSKILKNDFKNVMKHHWLIKWYAFECSWSKSLTLGWRPWISSLLGQFLARAMVDKIFHQWASNWTFHIDCQLPYLFNWDKVEWLHTPLKAISYIPDCSHVSVSDMNIIVNYQNKNQNIKIHRICKIGEVPCPTPLPHIMSWTHMKWE